MEKIIRIGIIGAGFARSTQIPGFANCKGGRIVAIASARREHAEEVGREFGIPNVDSDWRTLVARDEVDLVTIVTPVVTHCEMTLAALAHGKAVLCEKPMAMNADEAKRMTDAARDAGVLALIDHELRFLPGRLKMRELLQRGEIGKVKHASIIFRADSRADPNRPWNWWSDKTQGGGALGAIGSHVIDGFRWLLATEVDVVTCNLATHIRERKDHEGRVRPVTTDDEANLLLRFNDSEMTEGATANVSMSMVEAGRPEHRLEIFGDRGALRVDGDGKLWRANVSAGEWKKVEVDRGELAPGMSENGWARGFAVFSQKIIDALSAGRTTVEGAATFEDGYRTQLVLDAARKSNQSGCWSEPPAVAGG
ncbi:MAG TPA: Gfo/Idh/MocA family oxidoreductase [Pyrinomonadaceae bacterium]|nr:Gfo/Idh/MocA family oxidoreductase [Pyrinomonadaceae bacterium]